MVSILSGELELLKKIEQIEEEKHILLVAGKFSDFTELNEKLEKLICKNDKAEQKRIEITAKLIKEMKLEDNASMQNLIFALPTEHKKIFEDLYEEFKNILARIKFLTSTNSEMIKNTIRILDISLSHVTSDDDDYVYAKVENEKKKTKKAKSVLINELA